MILIFLRNLIRLKFEPNSTVSTQGKTSFLTSKFGLKSLWMAFLLCNLSYIVNAAGYLALTEKDTNQESTNEQLTNVQL